MLCHQPDSGRMHWDRIAFSSQVPAPPIRLIDWDGDGEELGLTVRSEPPNNPQGPRDRLLSARDTRGEV